MKKKDKKDLKLKENNKKEISSNYLEDTDEILERQKHFSIELENNETFEDFNDINKKHSYKFWRKLIIIIIFLGIFIRFYGVSRLVTKEYNIIDNNIPNGFDGLKIVQISDIHYGTTVNDKFLNKMVMKINELKPDIIVFTGDLIDNSINPTDKIKAEITVNLSKLESSLGKFAIMSNDDLKNDEVANLIVNSGFTLLNNESKLLFNGEASPILLVGLNNPKEKVNLTSDYKIALIHEPDDYDYLQDDNYNLVLAGHSHGGIIRLPYLGGLINMEGAKNYHDDYQKIGNTSLYIASGLGTSNINIRIFNQPAINLYRLYQN